MSSLSGLRFAAEIRSKLVVLAAMATLPWTFAEAQGTVPTFKYSAGQSSYTLAGRDPAQGGTTTLPTVLVPVRLTFAMKDAAGRPYVMSAGGDVARILRSPVFSPARFAGGGKAQYADAMLRATVAGAAGWHTLLGRPQVRPVTVEIPAGYGYVLSSKKNGGLLAIVDMDYVQREIFKQVPRQEGSLVIAVTRNTAYYAWGDATICCAWGTHGVDSASGNSFVLGSYLEAAPAMVADRDVQPLTEQLAEFVNDPLRDPLVHRANASGNGNVVPGWMHPAAANAGESGGRGGCGGTSIASAYVLNEPTDTNPRSELPVSKPFVAMAGGSSWHVQNVALMPWYTGGGQTGGGVYSFPDATVLSAAAAPCPAFNRGGQGRGNMAAVQPTVAAVASSGAGNGHRLIGYWGGGGGTFRLTDVAPQWDVIIVAFATPAKAGPEGTLEFRQRPGSDTEQFKKDIATLKSEGKKVMISLGGGGVYFKFDDPKSVANFVSSVGQIVTEYGFDGIDLDFETPSLTLDAGDMDFRHPTTPSVVHMIAALRQLHDRLGDGFMISLVPEGTQIPAGYPGYGGQFGSYLPILWAVRDILSFVDVQDYNTPPLEGVDGEPYQLGSVDYHAAMTELLLHGFAVGRDAKEFFPPLPADKVAVGFLVGATTPAIVSEAMDYIVTGKAPAGAGYKLRKPSGYPGMMGAMFWTIDADRRGNYLFSNKVGPQLHGYPAVK